MDATSAAPSVLVSCTVTNSGTRSGKEVPQLYVAFPASAGEPPQLLRGFRIVELASGEGARVAFTLAPRDLSTWSEGDYAWVPARGQFGVTLGASSRDARLHGTFFSL